MTALRFEQWWPYPAAVLVLAVWWFYFGAPFPNNPDGLMGHPAQFQLFWSDF